MLACRLKHTTGTWVDPVRPRASKRLAYLYRSGRINHWLKIKNPAAPAVKRKAEEDWANNRWGAQARLAMSDPKDLSYILIPGAGGMAWYWHRVLPLLEHSQREAITVDLPGDDESAGLD